MVEVRLFGQLYQHAGDRVSAPGAAMHLPAEGSETVGQILAQMGIEPQEVGNIFVNGKLLPREVYPILLGYQLTAGEPLTLEKYLATPIRSGDRVGVFPRKMSSVVV